MGDLSCHVPHSLINLTTEYHQWKLNEDIYHTFVNYLLCMNHELCKYEIRKILERFFLCAANHFCYTKHKQTNVMTAIDRQHTCVKKMVEECLEKKHWFGVKNLDKEYIEKMIDVLVLDRVANFLKLKDLPKITMENLNYGDDYIQFKDAMVHVPKTQIEKLKKFKEKDVALMILRYKAVLIGSQQWGLPQEIYDLLYSKYDARYEGFASPLNSRFLGKKDAYFCSIMYSVDQVFGSLGGFFSVDMLNPHGKKKGPNSICWIVNPPYILDILNRTIEKVLHAAYEAEKAGIRFVCFGTTPGWSDNSPFYDNLTTSRYVKHFEVLHKNKHFYTSDIVIVAKFKSFVYVIDSLDYTKPGSYTRVFDGMKVREKISPRVASIDSPELVETLSL